MVDFWGGVVHSDKNGREKSSVDTVSQTGDNNNLSSKLIPKPPTIFRSVLHSGNEFLSELHSKLNAALTFDEEDDEETDSRDDEEEEEEEEEEREAAGGASSSAASEVAGIGVSDGTKQRLSGVTKAYTQRKERVSELGERSHAASSFVVASSHRSSRNRRSKQIESSKTSSSSSSSKSRTTAAALPPSHRRNVGTSKARYRRSDVYKKPRSDTVSSTESASEAEGGIEGTGLPSASESSSFSLGNSASEGSLLSWTSSLSCDSQTEDGTAECMHFMKHFVEKLFRNNNCITLEEKAKFGELCQAEMGRLWFSRYVNTQRVNNRKVDESTFYSLVQYFAIVLFECFEADDYTPAKTLMNMCFTYYHELSVPGRLHPSKEFLYVYLREQSIWQSLRFWNAAFFDAVQCERAHKPVATREDVEQYSPEEINDEQEFQENITFGQLGSFTCNMHAFGLSRELCLAFLCKQAVIANLRQEQVKMLRENIERMYR